MVELIISKAPTGAVKTDFISIANASVKCNILFTIKTTYVNIDKVLVIC